jgi:hypothetical protein
MSTAMTVYGAYKPPSQASGRLRKAAEHYVRNGCKAIAPSLIYAGYSAMTASHPRKNNLTHDRLVQVAAYWNKGSQATARSHLADAIKTLSDMMRDTSEPASARGSAAKVIIDMSMKEAEAGDQHAEASEEQAKWLAQIKHWKRTFLRRGILLGMDADAYDRRGARLLAELNYALGKGPKPDWLEDDGDGEEGLLGPEGDLRPGSYVEAEIVESGDRGAVGVRPADAGERDAPGAGADPTGAE